MRSPILAVEAAAYWRRIQSAAAVLDHGEIVVDCESEEELAALATASGFRVKRFLDVSGFGGMTMTIRYFANIGTVTVSQQMTRKTTLQDLLAASGTVIYDSRNDHNAVTPEAAIELLKKAG